MAIATNSIHMPHSVGMRKAGETCILKVLAYFDIFHYPLTKNEIRKFLDHPLSEINFEESLEQMLSDEVIFLHNDFYSLQNNSLLAQRRKEGNRKAGKLLPKAFKIGRFLFHFPFVRAVFISGSLSKNFADEKADIDFFVITKANRLWIARTIMHLFKKLTFLTGHQHYFCMNYYIDEEALLIEDQNIFTAMEVATLVPVCGRKTIDSFFFN
ncbi:MAG: nucleotidyltransferase domain-containing protein [Chitinophagaceae bacterium]